MVGDAPEAEALAAGGPDARIGFNGHGRVESEEMPDHYGNADLLVAPALLRQVSGIVLLEALATGLPVVASRIEGFSELWTAAARLVPPGDPSALAEGISEMLAPEQRRALGQDARLAALSYAWESVSGLVEAAYGKMLGP